MRLTRNAPAVRWTALAALIACAVAALALATPAEGAPRPITGGHVNWGVKDSFRDYVEGPIANGTITVSGGATVNPDETFRFPVSPTGNYDPTPESGTASTQGSVRFLAHEGTLDMTISDIRIELSSDSGTLRADVVSRDLNTGVFQSYPDIAFASLNLTSVPPIPSGDTTVSWTAIPATLTAEGEPSFMGFYTAGTALDPVSMTLLLVDNCPAVSNPGQENADGDAWGDACDNCPAVATTWVVPTGDGDCDGFTTARETFLGTDVALRCAADAMSNNEPPPDRWPADFNDSRSVTTADVGTFIPRLNSFPPGPPYAVRWDMNANSSITSADVGLLVPFLNKSCT